MVGILNELPNINKRILEPPLHPGVEISKFVKLDQALLYRLFEEKATSKFSGLRR